ncbi:hypothetical protein ARMSODRAFT_1021787 [Armillaria solidipes]|uniref:Uncharacterized protein n=1 Tax=Armillaria solidipes TaxID=1076256 RepID=A0A2H3BNQ7_9AGAR|nr:hypothetical protein ARMSODRAFT_1021787 [Armillaria solidipes]
MDNFNIKYECLNERDDFQSQMRKGLNIVPSWDEGVVGDMDEPIGDYLPSTEEGNDLDEGNDGDIALSQVTDRQQDNQMADMRELLKAQGWCDEHPTEISNLNNSVASMTVKTGSEWNAIIKKKKQQVLDE